LPSLRRLLPCRCTTSRSSHSWPSEPARRRSPFVFHLIASVFPFLHAIFLNFFESFLIFLNCSFFVVRFFQSAC
jgi:hypothetical protein